MRVLLADRFPDVHLDALSGEHDVSYEPDLTADDLGARLVDHEVLVVRSTRVQADALETTNALRLVIRAGSGTDTIDAAAAARRGIAVCNVPGRNAVAVAELAFGLLLAIDRRIPDQVSDLRDGRWRKKTYQAARGISGRAVGVVGLGEIGMTFAERAAAFGCVVHAVGKRDRSPAVARRASAIDMQFVEDLEQLARTCDVLSFHVPLSETTRGMIGPPLLDWLQPSTILLNTARGELVDETALLAAIDEKDLWVGLDVYPDEPNTTEGSIDSALARHPNVVGTHHVGASTTQAQHAVADEVIAMIGAFGDGELRNCVNAAELAG